MLPIGHRSNNGHKCHSGELDKNGDDHKGYNST